MRVLHIISGLGQGGAETALYRLCQECSSEKHIVVSMGGEEFYSKRLSRLEIDVYHLNIKCWWSALTSLDFLYKIIKKNQPDIIQTWMYHADLYGGLVAKFIGYDNIIWGLRHGVIEKDITSNKTLVIIYLNSILSKFIPKLIISCSHYGAINHINIGYAKNKIKIIANGVDLNIFKPFNKILRINDLGLKINSEIPIIGSVGRFNPYKDYNNLFLALEHLRYLGTKFHCILIGDNLALSNQEIVKRLVESNLLDFITLLGKRVDIPLIMNSLDLFVLPSRGEAFPNVLTEAMACEIPCVTTDVGDAAEIVGETGWVVPKQNPIELALAIQNALNEWKHSKNEWINRKYLCRKRIFEKYSIQSMAKAYRSEWTKLVK